MKRRTSGSGRREIVRFQILELVDLRLDDDARNGPLKFPGYWFCYRIWSKAGSYPMNTGRSQAEIENWAYEIELAVATQNIYWAEVDYGKSRLTCDDSVQHFSMQDYELECMMLAVRNDQRVPEVPQSKGSGKRKIRWPDRSPVCTPVVRE